MNILQELLGEYKTDQFINTYLAQQPYAAPNAVNRFENLISWDLLKEILNFHTDCWLPSKGQLPLNPELNKGTLTSLQAMRGFLEGRTLQVCHAEQAHPLIYALAQQFNDLFKRSVDIQLYATPAGSEEFDWHYDVEDLFIIQSAGEKDFYLMPNTVTPRPLPVMNSQNMKLNHENKSTILHCRLQAGDWLYIPAGYWHKARALTDSFHLAVGVLLQPIAVTSIEPLVHHESFSKNDERYPLW